MLYNFSPPQSGPLAKRRKVRRACNFCREHRVRCDGMLPCSQCITNKVKCIKPKASNESYLLSHPQRPQNIRPSVPSCTAPAESAISSAPVDSPRNSTHEVARHPDYLNGFISRINTFCSVISQISTQESPDSGELSSSGTLYSTSNLIHGAEQSPLRLSPSGSKNLQERLLDIFRTRYLFLVPILTQTDLLAPESDQKREPSRNALMAYCLQSLYYAGLHDRFLSLSAELSRIQRSSSEKQQSFVVTLFSSYFQKALATNSQYLLYAEPSVSDIQRHILMALFLLNSGDVLAAYNITGAAVRLALSLNLQKPASPHVNAIDAKISSRAWWMLVHLDFRCSRHLGKPMAISLEDTTLTVPSYDPSIEPASSEIVFHSATITLTVVGKRIAECLAALHNTVNTKDSVPCIEQLAEHLTHEISPLLEWRDLILKTDPFKNLVLVGTANQPQEHAPEKQMNYSDDLWIYQQSHTRILQQTLLELQFHDLVIWFYRPFVQFPSHDLVPQHSPGADIHATTALRHAMKVTEIVHRRMLYHDALHGCSDVYQFVWNAVLTLVGFQLAYPLCYRSPSARQYTELSLQIFDTTKTSNPIASRAAHLTQYLLGRVDALIEVLNTQDSAFNSHGNSPTCDQVTNNLDSVALEQSSRPFLPTPETDSLWSWTDTVDPKAWSGYCNEISDMLIDFPDVPPSSNYFPLQ